MVYEVSFGDMITNGGNLEAVERTWRARLRSVPGCRFRLVNVLMGHLVLWSYNIPNSIEVGVRGCNDYRNVYLSSLGCVVVARVRCDYAEEELDMVIQKELNPDHLWKISGMHALEALAEVAHD